MWRLGRAIERADMTTRVLGVRAAAVLSQPGNGGQREGPRRGAVDGRAALGVGPADVPAGGPRADRGDVGRALPARARPLPAGRAGPDAGDPPGARRAARSRRPVGRRRPRRGRGARIVGGEHGRAGARQGDGRPAGRHRPARQADHRSLPVWWGRDRGSAPAHRPTRRGERQRRAAPAVPPRPPRADPAAGRGRSDDRGIARRSPRPRAARRRRRAPAERPWRLDPVPLILDGQAFAELASGGHRARRRDGGAAGRPLRAPAGRQGGLGAGRGAGVLARATAWRPSAPHRRSGG